MIAISLLYFWCKSYVATIKHKKVIMHNISNLYFLDILKSAYMEGFPKSGHISIDSGIGELEVLPQQNL